MATANSIDQILRDLLGPEGCNGWFSDDLPARDEDVLSAAVSSSSKETEHICKTAPFSLKGFQSYLDEAAIQDGVPKVKSLPMSMSLTGSGSVHKKFAEPKTDEEVLQARESTIPEKMSPRNGILCACECGIGGLHLGMNNLELRIPMFHL